MENFLPFLDVVRNAREHQKKVKEGKRRQIETNRTALKNISNKSSGSQINNDLVPPSKRLRTHGAENKENAKVSSSSKCSRSTKVKSGRPQPAPESSVFDDSVSTLSTSVSTISSQPSSQGSQEGNDAVESENAIRFYETDFALSLTVKNPSEIIFEVPQYVVDMYFLEQDRELAESNLIYDFFTPPLPPGVHGPQLVRQTQVSKEILGIVVDWMVEVQENMEMNHETFYLAVIMMYRYMSVVPNISKRSIQLLACTSMWLASKYEERVSPAVRDYIYICDDAFSARDFIAMEQKLFFALNESCHRPISYVFLRRYSRVADGDNMRMQFLSRYYLELTLQKPALMLNRESLKAAGALWLTRVTLKFPEDKRWPDSLRFFTRYEEHELLDFVQDLHRFVKEVPRSNLQTTYVKYSNKVFLEVATLQPLPDIDLQNIINKARVIQK